MNKSHTYRTSEPVPDNAHTLFKVKGGGLDATFEGQDAAVDRAKSLSSSRNSPIHVERLDRRLKMTFQHGSLQQYRFETR